jgi:hypothetical protein
MFKKIIIFSILSLALSQSGLSQDRSDTTFSDFGISIGINSYQIKEKVLNKIRHTGLFPALGFSYDWSNEHVRQKVELFLIVNMLKSRYEAETAPVVIDFTLNYTQNRKVTVFHPDLHLFLGGSVGLYSHMGWFDNWDDSHIYWLTYYYVGLNSLLTYKRPSEPSAYVELNIPLLSLVSRPPERFFYKGINDKFSWIVKEIHKDLKMTTIHQHLVLNVDLGYKFIHSKSFQQKVYWRINYTNTQMSYSNEVIILTYIIGTTLLF